MRPDRRQGAASPRRSEELGGEQVEGLQAVRLLLSAGKRPVRRIWLSEARARAPQGPLADVIALARDRGVRIELRTNENIAEMSATGAAQGAIAWAEPVVAVDLDDVLRRAVPTGEPAFLVVLDGVTDPGNFGAVLRTAACAGAHGVVVSRHRSAALTPAAVKAAAGAVELVPIAQVAGAPAALSELSRAGVWVAGMEPGAGGDLWSSSILDGPVAIVLGSEGAGISRLARKRCDVLLQIPQALALGSLNIAAAAAVACFEVARRRSGASGSRKAL
ncbi:MAG TPA: 23S rRNA (guanosine(2251)-2'-O)-methyltransferase RlmB [Acidimicrobiales bacterium]|nr:23S rRNA (guanosine(2251)-2'-O)-methyltransferase RlmB [Acidimicrobiales bacterium]